MPMVVVFRNHPVTLVMGILSSIATFVLFYLMTVFALSWGTTALHYSRATFLMIQLVGIVFFALTIPLSAVLAERGRRRTLLWVTVAIGAFGLVLAPLLSSGLVGATLAMIIGLSLMGLTYGPLGTTLSELFPTAVRYTGSSLTFNLAGIFGASLAPYIATYLATNYGLQYVGYYLTAPRFSRPSACSPRAKHATRPSKPVLDSAAEDAAQFTATYRQGGGPVRLYENNQGSAVTGSHEEQTMAHTGMQTSDWRSDGSLAYGLFRFTFGLNIMMRGIVRIALGLPAFQNYMLTQFKDVPVMPPAFLIPFARCCRLSRR